MVFHLKILQSNIINQVSCSSYENFTFLRTVWIFYKLATSEQANLLSNKFHLKNCGPHPYKRSFISKKKNNNLLTKFSIAVDDSSHNEFGGCGATADEKLNGK